MRFNPKVLKTSTFRLVTIYLALFALSVAVILGYVYWNTAGLMERQTDATITTEVQSLYDQYQIFGVLGIAASVEKRSREPGAGVYLLRDNTGKLVTGNISALPNQIMNETGWIEFPLEVSQGNSTANRSARAYRAILNNKYDLVVGRDVEELRQFADIIKRSLFAALGFSLVLGLGGGWAMSRNFLRRIDAITDTSRTIMAGNLSQRMPISHTDDELDRLANSLNEMLDQIERLMQGIKEVSSNIAHDLKTPLTRMRARVEAALRTGNSENGDEYQTALLATIDETDRLLHTFNALLFIAKAEAGQVRDHMGTLDVGNIIADVAELYEPIIEDEEGSLTLHTEQGLIVRGDRELLAQALSNLLSNAIKYGITEENAKPEITIKAYLQEDHVIIIVCDRGQGIPAQERERVLERFVRLDESRSKPGNGLGLSIVAGVMRLHNGTILLEDHNPGLCAKLTLPLYKTTG